MLGARVFEKHVTLNRADKGTDHSFALEQKGFMDFTRDLIRTPLMYKPKTDEHIGNEAVFKKLGKSVVALIDIKSGEKVNKTELSKLVAQKLAKKAQEKNITKIYFDRGLYKYHGRVKAFAETLRANGMEF